MKLTRRKLIFWYKIYELQATEKEIANDILSKPNASLPDPDRMRKLVDDKIESRRKSLRLT